MDDRRFDALARRLGSVVDRRGAVHLLAGSLAGITGLASQGVATAKKKKRCRPKCARNRCGPDGCGGTCGSCAKGTVCTAGQCTTYRFVRAWGSSGKGNGQFRLPNSITVDSASNVHVLDAGNNRVQKFNGEGKFLKKWGSYGSGTDEFWSPEGIAVDGDDNVYVADRYNSRIQKFDSNGTFLATFASVQAEISVDQPSAVAIAADGSIYYANSVPYPIIWHIDANGDYIVAWQPYAFGVNDMAIDQDGNLFLALSLLGGADVIRKVAGNGAEQSEWSLPGEYSTPEGIAVDADGSVFAVDWSKSRVLKYSGTGTLLTQWGREGTGDGEFDIPADVAVGPDGSVYVADSSANRISVFRPVAGA